MFVGLSALGLVSALPAFADIKPNIVFILVDDLGWKDVGYHSSDIKTPNIDKLAASGARLEQFYSQQIRGRQPRSPPTRRFASGHRGAERRHRPQV